MTPASPQSPRSAISSAPLPHRHIEVLDHQMAVVDLPAAPSAAPSGRTLLFQHGNPTSSYLWRNIMPHLTHHGRCVAVDLIGMGQSDKLSNSGPGRYTFAEHARFLDAALEELDIGDDVIWVIHDWGSALGFYWSHRHAERVRGIAYMEAMIAPVPSWEDWNEASRRVFQGFRSENGEAMVLDKNIFVERVLPGSILRSLSDAEMDAYRTPFANPGEDRRPTLSWPRQIPIAGEPADVVARVADYAEWLAHSAVPKLFINAEPGAILTGQMRDACRRFPNQTEVTVAGSHFIQEDSPAEITAAIDAWIKAEL
ncbi:MAG: haloalkane dehalogenase [Kiloniella sp.]|nr:haloalkane dehalogenase [Kiloniella sp.]